MKRVAYIFAICVFVIITAACGTTMVNTPQAKVQFSQNDSRIHYPIVISNYDSKINKVNIVFNKAPQRVFAHHQNSIETLLALGLEDRIVACAGDIPPVFKSDAYEYREGFKKANYIGPRNPPIEDMLVMNLDLIIGWHSTFSEKTLGTTDFWQARNVNTYMAESTNAILPRKTIDDECSYILHIGKIFDREEKANAIVREMQKEMQQIAALTVEQQKPKVMVIELMKNTITVYGENQLAGNMVTRLGAELLDSGNRVNYEELINLNPDVVFIAFMGDDGQKYVDQFLQTEALASVTCVKNKRAYAIPLTYMLASATRTLDGIRVFAKGLYPALYMEKKE